MFYLAILRKGLSEIQKYPFEGLSEIKSIHLMSPHLASFNC